MTGPSFNQIPPELRNKIFSMCNNNLVVAKTNDIVVISETSKGFREEVSPLLNAAKYQEAGSLQRQDCMLSNCGLEELSAVAMTSKVCCKMVYSFVSRSAKEVDSQKPKLTRCIPNYLDRIHLCRILNAPIETLSLLLFLRKYNEENPENTKSLNYFYEDQRTDYFKPLDRVYAVSILLKCLSGKPFELNSEHYHFFKLALDAEPQPVPPSPLNPTPSPQPLSESVLLPSFSPPLSPPYPFPQPGGLLPLRTLPLPCLPGTPPRIKNPLQIYSLNYILNRRGVFAEVVD